MAHDFFDSDPFENLDDVVTPQQPVQQPAQQEAAPVNVFDTDPFAGIGPKSNLEDLDFAKQLSTDDQGDEEALAQREVKEKKRQEDLDRSAVVNRHFNLAVTGAVQGVREVGQGVAGLVRGAQDIIDPELFRKESFSRRKRSLAKSKKQRERFLKSIGDLNEDEQSILQLSRQIGGIGGTLIGPPGAGLVARGAVAAASSALLTEAQDPGNVKEIAKSAAIGAVAPAALTKLALPLIKLPFKIGSKTGRAVGRLLGNKRIIAKDIAEQVAEAPGQRQIQKRIQSAEELALPLTPAEAAGRGASNLIEQQKKLGFTDRTKAKLDQFYFDRGLRSEKTVRGLLNKIHTGPAEAKIADDFKNFEATLIRNAQKELNAEARPFYEKAYATKLPPKVQQELLEDPMLQSLLGKASKDPLFQREVGKYPEDSLARWDVIKKMLDDKIEAASSAVNPKANLARQLISVKEFLVSKLDKVSPDYKKARAVYGENVGDIALLRNSPLGKLYRLQGKSVLNKVFDQNEPDTELLKTVRDMVLAERPELWYGMARKRLEQEIGKVSKQIQNNPEAGPAFFRGVLGDSNKRKVWFNVLGRAPESKKTMVHMLRTFDSIRKRDLGVSSPELLGGIGGIEQGASTSSARQSGLFIKSLVLGKYDAAVADVILSPRWIKQYEKIAKKQPTSRKAQKELIDLFSRYIATEYPALEEENE